MNPLPLRQESEWPIFTDFACTIDRMRNDPALGMRDEAGRAQLADLIVRECSAVLQCEAGTVDA